LSVILTTFRKLNSIFMHDLIDELKSAIFNNWNDVRLIANHVDERDRSFPVFEYAIKIDPAHVVVGFNSFPNTLNIFCQKLESTKDLLNYISESDDPQTKKKVPNHMHHELSVKINNDGTFTCVKVFGVPYIAKSIGEVIGFILNEINGAFDKLEAGILE